jgi:hypothetical protein
VADFTYVASAAGTVYVALVIDVFSRRILGWRVDTTMTAALVLAALERAIWTRHEAGVTTLDGLIHHSDAGAQYTSLAFNDRLAAAGAVPSIGTVGDAYDNALAESTIGLYKTELIDHQGPWRTATQIEAATMSYVHWYNHDRPHTAAADIPPADFEALYPSNHARLTQGGPDTTPIAATKPGAVHARSPTTTCLQLCRSRVPDHNMRTVVPIMVWRGAGRGERTRASARAEQQVHIGQRCARRRPAGTAIGGTRCPGRPRPAR